MKNIHILKTDKPSRLHNTFNTLRLEKGFEYSPCNLNIYITSDEEIKKGDWVVCWEKDYENVEAIKTDQSNYTHWIIDADNYKKIILTTDQDLIKNGVQSIDDEFLEWFVKNPSCEYVNAYWYKGIEVGHYYKIDIPKEESKQETLEEAAEKHHDKFRKDLSFAETRRESFKEGAKWQAQKMYSEEEVMDLFRKYQYDLAQWVLRMEDDIGGKPIPTEWFEQFKKK
jgi:hypothetical protein